MAKTETDPRVTKRKVTMKSAVIAADGKTYEHEATDYVREDFLEPYVAKAKESWQSVIVSDEYDAGPGGYDGATSVPGNIDHELAGQTFAATEEG